MWTKEREIQAGEDFIRLDEAREQRLRALEQDKAFVVETTKVRIALEGILRNRPSVVRRFFKRFSYPLVYRPGRIDAMLRNIKDEQAVKAFRQYVRYAARFQVRLALRKDIFTVLPVAPVKTKYAVRIVNQHFEPADPVRRKEQELLFEEIYADDELAVGEKMASFLASGDAKFVRIDDPAGESLLSELESFAYGSESVTFIVHEAPQQKYVFCLVGETVTMDKTWRQAGKVMTGLHAELYGRTKAGRPTNIPRLKEAMKLREPDGRSLKEKAFALGSKSGRLESGQHYLSQAAKKLKAVTKSP